MVLISKVLQIEIKQPRKLPRLSRNRLKRRSRTTFPAGARIKKFEILNREVLDQTRITEVVRYTVALEAEV